ncbi:hypothetical protein [Oceanobacter mangrovi]|uniref:hypothetical protein n=1 Tax=Oceanobacter mangrovi TaxID=2862510 RepID=UPI001C8EA6D7|nr:hypothetical protein [Oceanobacter mangrovi]
MDWTELLQLSKSQQTRIERIETDYQQRFVKLRENLGPGWGESFDEQRWLKERTATRDLSASMRIELQSVLTTEQRQQADQIVQDFHSRATADLIARMVRGVNLSPDQQQQLQGLSDELIKQFSWPVDHSQIEAGRVGVERALSEVLTSEQLAQVQQRKQQQRRSWPKLDDMMGSPFHGSDMPPPPDDRDGNPGRPPEDCGPPDDPDSPCRPPEFQQQGE